MGLDFTGMIVPIKTKYYSMPRYTNTLYEIGKEEAQYCKGLVIWLDDTGIYFRRKVADGYTWTSLHVAVTRLFTDDAYNDAHEKIKPNIIARTWKRICDWCQT